jgi:glycosyl transferase family 25
MELLKHTIFINLEERTDRLAHIKDEFQKLGIEGERMNAVKLASGAIGCTMSHIKCLELAKKRNLPYVFICEDDITFLDIETFKKSIQEFKESRYSKKWDVLIISGNNCPLYKKLSDSFIQVYNCQTTTGYIVNNHYYDTLLANFKEGVKLLLQNPENKREYAIDIYWKRLQASDNWYMIIPPTVIQYNNYSDVEQKNVNYANMMLDLDKEWLFKQNMNQPMPQPMFGQLKVFPKNK